mmetsp:Transcript_33146/g.55559  ORF Transcript_33146/g.55559 Transcript_33146/m.55559 type:complete len:507 (-) Transcript_33146:126-1646(-)|eukprot:CAMPEP_0198200594 /NCGR_PEP_ID=MMETSP1445-20131203/3585_1 /TAXON_ID=36898 /ORGANISM="Pyramimonas sp., Strain CCMP2087" /LENGTH=506 /DNA_ID=CAMNT_0043870715 /DNA_START=230 /DNA_END=1750 /DNA_ORIENTATION=-
MWTQVGNFLRKKQKPELERGGSSSRICEIVLSEEARCATEEEAEQRRRSSGVGALPVSDAKQPQQQSYVVDDAEPAQTATAVLPQSASPSQIPPQDETNDRKNTETQLLDRLQSLSAAETMHPADKRKIGYISKALSQISCNVCAQGVLKAFSHDLTRITSMPAKLERLTSQKAMEPEISASSPMPIPNALPSEKRPSICVKRVEFSSSEPTNKFKVSMLSLSQLDASTESNRSQNIRKQTSFKDPIGSVRSWMLEGQQAAAGATPSYLNTRRESVTSVDFDQSTGSNSAWADSSACSQGSEQSLVDFNDRNSNPVKVAGCAFTSLTLRRSTAGSANALNKVVVGNQSLETRGSKGDLRYMKAADDRKEEADSNGREALVSISWTSLYGRFTTDCCHAPGLSTSSRQKSALDISSGDNRWQQRSANAGSRSTDRLDHALRVPEDMDNIATQKKVIVRRDGSLTSVPFIVGKGGCQDLVLDQRRTTWLPSPTKFDSPLGNSRRGSLA